MRTSPSLTVRKRDPARALGRVRAPGQNQSAWGRPSSPAATRCRTRRRSRRATRSRRGWTSPLKLPGEKAEKAAEKLGLDDVGDAARPHPARSPRRAHDRRAGARTRSRRSSSRCCSITSRPVRRRGMKPLVEARVADETGHDDGHVLQPAVARAPLPARHAAAADRQVARPPRAASASTSTPRPASWSRRARTWRPTRPREGLTSVQIAALVHEHRATMRDVLEPLPARIRVLERLPDRCGGARRRALRRPGGRPPAARVRRVPAAADRAAAPPRAPPRGRARGRAGRRRATLTARWLARLAAVHAHRRPAPRDGGGRRGHRPATARCSGC